MELLLIIISIFSIINFVLLRKAIKQTRNSNLEQILVGERTKTNDTITITKVEIMNEIRASRTETNVSMQESLRTVSDTLSTAQKQTAEMQDKRLLDLIQTTTNNQDSFKKNLEEKILGMTEALSKNFFELQEAVTKVNTMLADAQRKQFDLQDKKMTEINLGLSNLLTEKQDSLQKLVGDRLTQIDDKFKNFSIQNKESLDEMRNTVEKRLSSLQEDNMKQLDKMRETVDEKLQKTLDERITQSFKLVNDRLQEVYTGLGEMKNLANGVGDLKKVLTNVKTRGILGELQLGAILEEILSKEQYEENVVTKLGSTYRVEFAIKLPADEGKSVYLPIDAKFPGETYHALVDAYESGDANSIAQAYAALEVRIKGCAKDIHDKYIDPPNTTDFAIMFLPFEGLYAEVVRHGLVETLQRQYKVNIAGPTTIAALLNSLQMGFKTLAIQKRSSEVWNILGAVKTEFNTFTNVLELAQKRIEQTGLELDKLIGVRTRKINSKLRSIAELPVAEAQALLVSTELSEEDGERPD